MRVTYDRSADAAYIYLVDSIEPGEAVCNGRCVVDDQTRKIYGMINLDFDRFGRLLGIEAINASLVLRPELLQQAVRR